MEWIRQLQSAVEYMEDHLLEDINYEDAARHVYLSGYTFHRTFSLMAGMTANQYIRNRRLSLAAQDLQQNGLSVLDAALKYGYDSPESFSKAFSRFHGCTPSQAKIAGTPLRMFNPLVIKITLEGGSIMEYRIIKQPQQTFLALVRAFPNEIINDKDDHSIPGFWDECHAKQLVEPIRSLRPEGRRDLYGLCSPTKKQEEYFRYGIGIIMDEETDLSHLDELLAQGYQLWKTEPAEYVVFKCLGADGECISQTWSRFFREFLPQSDYEQTDLTDYEIYFEKGEKDLFCELWIPIKKPGR